MTRPAGAKQPMFDSTFDIMWHFFQVILAIGMSLLLVGFVFMILVKLWWYLFHRKD